MTPTQKVARLRRMTFAGSPAIVAHMNAWRARQIRLLTALAYAAAGSGQQ